MEKLIEQGNEEGEGREMMKAKCEGVIRQKERKGELQCLLGVNHRGAEQKLLLFLFLLPAFLIRHG